MENAEPTTLPESSVNKNKFLKTNLPLVIAATLLIGSSFMLGYTVGHRQGLTVVGYDADAEQLVDVVQKQKAALDSVSKSLNAAVQERDMAVGNAEELFKGINQANADKAQFASMNTIYRDILRQRGGLSLTVQDFAIKSLPENAFEYQLDLMQVSPGKSRASGSAELRLIKGTEVLTVPMEDNNFNFENNERLTGRWTMPKGFSPDFIEVRLSSSGKQVIRRFSWSKGQPVTDQSAFLSEIPQTEANTN